MESGERKKQSAQDPFRCFPCLGRFRGEAVPSLRGGVGDVGKVGDAHAQGVCNAVFCQPARPPSLRPGGRGGLRRGVEVPQIKDKPQSKKVV